MKLNKFFLYILWAILFDLTAGSIILLILLKRSKNKK